MLWPPAAVISSARFANSCPLTSIKSKALMTGAGGVMAVLVSGFSP